MIFFDVPFNICFRTFYLSFDGCGYTEDGLSRETKEDYNEGLMAEYRREGREENCGVVERDILVR